MRVLSIDSNTVTTSFPEDSKGERNAAATLMQQKKTEAQTFPMSTSIAAFTDNLLELEIANLPPTLFAFNMEPLKPDNKFIMSNYRTQAFRYVEDSFRSS